jgi:BirA family biotin operon repressor/biotin-[acetyl-CoA-carboxylase] ligase
MVLHPAVGRRVMNTGHSRMTDDLRAAIEAAAERLGPFSRRLVAYDAIGSTNDEAVRLANLGAAEGTTVMTDAQTSGRGRSGRLWFSPPGAGLYVSVVFRPKPIDATGAVARTIESNRLVTLAAGVAVAEGIRAATGLPAEIKWPNDIVIGDGTGARIADRRWRKLAGILTEAAATGDELQHLVVGFGINVARATYPREIASYASSLEAETGRPVTRGAVLVECLDSLWARYTDLEDRRERAVLDRWRELSPSAAGSRVAVHRDEHTIDGVTAGVSDQGALRVRTERGIETVTSGEVTWI